MKKLLTVLLGFFIFGVSSAFANASPELVQMISFTWDGVDFQFAHYGTAVAIDEDHLITNAHLVTQGGKLVDFVLLCPTPDKNHISSECYIPAGVLAVHSKFDAALLQLYREEDFLPYTGRKTTFPKKETPIKIEGYQIKTDILQTFEDSLTFNFISNWIKNGGILRLPNSPFIKSRGEISNIAKLKKTGAKYFMSNIQLNLNQTGGMAYDNNHNFIGIPTLNDGENNLLILDFAQLKDWIVSYENKSIEIPADILRRYNQRISGSVTLKYSELSKSSSDQKKISHFIVKNFDPDRPLNQIHSQKPEGNEWYSPYLKQLFEWNVLSEYPDKKEVQKPITRDQMARYIALTFDLPLPNPATHRPSYQDVRVRHNDYRFIEAVGNLFPNQKTKKFRPQTIANRADILSYTLQASGVPIFLNWPTSVFTDIDREDYAANYIITAQKYGIVQGFENQKFTPNGDMSLAEFAKTLVETRQVQERFPSFLQLLQAE